MPNKKKIRAVVVRVFVFSAGLSFGLIAFLSISQWIFKGDALAIRSFRVHETERIGSKEITEYLKDFLGTPLYGTRLEEIAKRLTEHPLVAQAHIKRNPPHEIEIVLSERKAIAILDGTQNLFLDESSQVFSFIYPQKTLELPKIDRRLHPKQLLRVADAINSYTVSKPFAGQIIELDLDENGAITVSFSTGLRVKIGKGNFEKKWEKLRVILSDVKNDDIPFSYIYLDKSPNLRQFAVKFK